MIMTCSWLWKMTEGSHLKSSKFFGSDENEDVVEEDVNYGLVE